MKTAHQRVLTVLRKGGYLRSRGSYFAQRVLCDSSGNEVGRVQYETWKAMRSAGLLNDRDELVKGRGDSK